MNHDAPFPAFEETRPLGGGRRTRPFLQKDLEVARSEKTPFPSQ